MQRDPAGPSGHGHYLAEPVQPVDGKDCVGSLGCGSGASRSHRNADVRQGQCGRVVDAVADHDNRSAAPLQAHRVQFLGRSPLGKHDVHADDRPDCLRDLSAVAGDHDDAVDSTRPQRPDRPGGIRPEGIVQDQNPGRLAVDSHEHRQSTVEPCPPPGGFRPARRPLRPADPAPDRLPHGYRMTANYASDANARYLLYLLRHAQLAPEIPRGADDGARQDVTRLLIQRSGQL